MDKLVSLIKENNNFAIFSHIAPDGDTLGSAAALVKALTMMGKNCHWFCDGEIPHSYAMFPEIKDLIELPKIKNFDVAIAVDCSELSRLGNCITHFNNVPVRAQIDHHSTNDNYAQINIVKQYPACGLLIMELLDAMGISLTTPIAAALFIAISTDTGRLSYEGVDSFTVAQTARLYDFGVNIYDITSKLYNLRTYTKTKLIGEALQNLSIDCNGKVAYILLDKHSFVITDSDTSETEGLVDYAKEIEGVEIAFMLRCSGDGEYKCSLRCNSPYDVASIAQKFNGGGHKLAAGCTLKGSLYDALESCLTAIKEQLQEKVAK